MRFSFKRALLLACLLPMILAVAGCTTGEEQVALLAAKAEKGDVDAMVELGDIYYGAKNMDWSDATGAKWMKMAAEHGNPRAQYTIGVAYAKGLGVSIDLVEGHKWEYLAYCSGFAPAKKAMEEIELMMRPRELRKAKELEQQLGKCSI